MAVSTPREPEVRVPSLLPRRIETQFSCLAVAKKRRPRSNPEPSRWPSADRRKSLTADRLAVATLEPVAAEHVGAVIRNIPGVAPRLAREGAVQEAPELSFT